MENFQLKSHQLIRLENFKAKKNNSIRLAGVLYCFVAPPDDPNSSAPEGVTQVVIPPDLIDDIVQITALNVWNKIFIATPANLITFDIEDGGFSTTNYQESNFKIVQTSWNPTQTFLVVIDSSGTLSGFSFKPNMEYPDAQQFIPSVNGSLHDSVRDSVYVGWGAHNTQFKGLKKQEEEEVEEIPQPYSHPIISWRGNGEMFVVNYWKDNRRFLKMFDSDIRPLFASSAYNNLLAPTSFKDEGNFIACAATDGHINKIVIFEKNCLVKSTFLVPENKGEIIDVQYHHEKHMLAVHSQLLGESCVNIYLYSNDTWYLKQQLIFPTNEDDDFLTFRWFNDLNARSCTFIISTSQSIQTYKFALETFGVYNDLVGVINGSSVSFTEFSQEIIPPPISSKILNFDKPVNYMSYYSAGNVYSFCLSDNQVIYYQYNDGTFTNYNGALLEGDASNNTMSSFEKECNGIVHKISLNEEQELTIDGRVLVYNVLSVHLHGDYLIFTAVDLDSCKLFSMRFTQGNLSTFNLQNAFSREVEQGAKIISVTNEDDIILLIPRGNLETVTCRLIAIDTIEKLLSQNHWCQAINQIRHQKLNWNLLIDLNKQRFLEHIPDFLLAAHTISVLNNIIMEFANENCLETMYKFWSKPLANDLLQEDVKELTKIEILSAILSELVESYPIRNLVSIVTLQINHYSVKAALNSVLDVFELNELDACKEAVALILRYKHAQDVINAAYTLYNIEFLKWIYCCCSEDPRAYMPELEQLLDLDEIDLKFTMNLRGKDFSTATRYLIRSSSKDDHFITEFIIKHTTQDVAYNSMRPGQPRFSLISHLYADYLAMKAKHNEAGLILERAGLHESALIRYKIARNWRKVLSLLNALKVDDNEKTATLSSLAQDLINHKQIDEGAFILEHYCSQHIAAIRAFIEHNMFQKALCLAQQYDLEKLDEALIQPSLRKYREGLYDRISEFGGKFNEHTVRLLAIRKRKSEKLLRRQAITRGLELEVDAMDFETDSINSEYGSILSSSSLGSGSSRSSSLSSRNRRKLERKKTDLREGGTYEDIALIRQLYLLAVDIFALRHEVEEVCYTVVNEDNFEFSKDLQVAFRNIYQQVLDRIPRIWSDVFLNADVSTEPTVLAVIENRLELDEQFRTPPPLEKLEDWHF